MTWGMGGGPFPRVISCQESPGWLGWKRYTHQFSRELYIQIKLSEIYLILAFVPFWVIFKMVTCGILDYGNSWTKSKTIEVKGWHKVPTSNKVERMEWLYVMKRVPLYPSDENFYWQSPLCGQSLRARFKSTYSCSYCL